jgi:hypothetical protein
LTTIYDFVLEIVAVFIGAFAAFELDSYRDRKAEEKERKRFLELIRREVKANERILDGMILVESQPAAIPSSRPIRNVWEGITEKLALLRNEKLLEEATLLYFDLANLDGILGMYREHSAAFLYASPEEKERTKPILARERAYYVHYIKNYLLEQIQKVLKLIEVELGQQHVALRKTESDQSGALQVQSSPTLIQNVSQPTNFDSKSKPIQT